MTENDQRDDRDVIAPSPGPPESDITAGRLKEAAMSTSKLEGFEEFRAQVLHSYGAMSDRELGMAWMRAEEFRADDKILLMHPRDATAPHVVTDEDVQLTLAYGPLRFKAFAPAQLLPITDKWQGFLEENFAGRTLVEHRAATRRYIVDELVAQRLAEDPYAYTFASAVLWLAVTSERGVVLVCGSYKAVHVEIVDVITPEGCNGNNFRLWFNRTHEEPIPDEVRTIPSPHGKPAR